MKTLLSVAVACMAACSTERGASTTWEELKVEALQLELEDNERYESLAFHPAGTVAVTIGRKGGPVAGLLFYWYIDANRLVITEFPNGEGTFQNVFKDPKVSGNRLSVSVSGARDRTYVIHRSAA